MPAARAAKLAAMLASRGVALRFALVVLVSVVAVRVRADEPSLGEDSAEAAANARARALFEEGVRLAESGSYEAALAVFETSLALVPRASVSYKLAWVLRALGRDADAYSALERARDLPATSDERSAIDALRALLAPHVAIVIVETSRADVVVCIDEVCVPQRLSTQRYVVSRGAHRIRAEAPGFRAAAADVVASVGVERHVTLVLAQDVVDAPEVLDAPHARPRRARRIALFSAAGVVVVGTVVAVLLTRRDEPYAGTLFSSR
jgi:hypothetical protein